MSRLPDSKAQLQNKIILDNINDLIDSYII